jgi:hypothetical protein
MQPGPFSINLTDDETALVDAIKFDPNDCLGNTQAFHTNGNLVVQLTSSLLKRKAIPDHRLAYFSDPEYNVGGRGKSRRDVFFQNGHNDDSLMRHGHFLQYLRYFIHGADLPTELVASFKKAVENCGMVTSGDIAPLTATARQLTRTHRLNPKSAADEFFKLSLDLGLDPSVAASIRSAVLRTK